jgi:hypothetical protein
MVALHKSSLANLRTEKQMTGRAAKSLLSLAHPERRLAKSTSYNQLPVFVASRGQPPRRNLSFWTTPAMSPALKRLRDIP